jgi:hypothetical protein
MACSPATNSARPRSSSARTRVRSNRGKHPGLGHADAAGAVRALVPRRPGREARCGAKGGLCRLLVRSCFFCIRTTKEASDRHDPSLLLVVLNGSGPFVCRCATKGDELAPRSASALPLERAAARARRGATGGNRPKRERHSVCCNAAGRPASSLHHGGDGRLRLRLDKQERHGHHRGSLLETVRSRRRASRRPDCWGSALALIRRRAFGKNPARIRLPSLAKRNCRRIRRSEPQTSFAEAAGIPSRGPPVPGVAVARIAQRGS